MNKADKKKVFLVEHIHPEARKQLEKHFEIINDYNRINEVEGLINRNQLKVNKEFLDKATNLKVIGIHGTGRDAVDVEEAESRGIKVFSTPGINARSVAELNVALALDLSRDITKAAQAVKEGKNVSHEKDFFRGNEISGKTYGFIGVGNIACQTINMLKYGFNAKIIAWSRSLTMEKADLLGIGYCKYKEEVLVNSDIIILGLALNDDTFHIIGEKEFKLCRKDALFINTARGKLVDENALYMALTNGTIKKAACDVFEKEPLSNDNPLVSLDNFIGVPHLGSNTEEALYKIGMAVVRGIYKELEE